MGGLESWGEGHGEKHEIHMKPLTSHQPEEDAHPTLKQIINKAKNNMNSLKECFKRGFKLAMDKIHKVI